MQTDADHIIFSKNGVEINFDIIIQTKKDVLCCCMIKQSQGFETAAAVIEGGKHMGTAKAYYLLGHTNHHATDDTATHLGWGKLKDSGAVYQPCAKANSK